MNGSVAVVRYESVSPNISVVTTQVIRFDESRSCLSMKRHVGFYQDGNTLGIGKIYYAQPVVVVEPGFRLPEASRKPLCDGQRTRCLGSWVWECTGPNVENGHWVWVDDHRFVSVDEANATLNNDAAGCESSPAVFLSQKLAVGADFWLDRRALWS
jgi:hypothetical protein